MMVSVLMTCFMRFWSRLSDFSLSLVRSCLASASMSDKILLLMLFLYDSSMPLTNRSRRPVLWAPDVCMVVSPKADPIILFLAIAFLSFSTNSCLFFILFEEGFGNVSEYVVVCMESLEC